MQLNKCTLKNCWDRCRGSGVWSFLNSRASDPTRKEK